MAQKEAAFSSQHSAVSQNQKRLTTEDTESTHPNEPKPGSLGATDTEEDNRAAYPRQDGTGERYR